MLPPTDRRYYPLFAECVELDVPFCTQVGHTGPLRRSETGQADPVHRSRSRLTSQNSSIVCGHIGYPWTEEMVAVARKHPNVYIDTSAYTTKRLPAELVRTSCGPATGTTKSAIRHQLSDDSDTAMRWPVSTNSG